MLNERQFEKFKPNKPQGPAKPKKPKAPGRSGSSGSGGYNQVHANELLTQNDGVIASFSRALTEGLKFQQSASEFNETLDKSIQEIYMASVK
jgi:hypothetical protein